MQKHVLLGAAVLAVLICWNSAPAEAQGLDVFGGYSYELNNTNVSAVDPGVHGYNLAVTANLNRHIGIEANFAGHNGRSTVYSDATETDTVFTDNYTYTFGPKLTQPVGNFDIYTHFLVGAMQAHEGESDICTASYTCSVTGSAHGTGFGFVTGGGVDWFHGHWGIRILEVDYVRGEPNFTSASSNSANVVTAPGEVSDFRLATGVIWRFGK
jgi:hypothetical protein